MMQSARTFVANAVQRSPLQIVAGYTAIVTVEAAVTQLGKATQSAPLILLAALVWFVVGCVFVVAMSIHRSEDTLAVGVLVAGAGIIAGILARAVIDAVTSGSPGAFALIFMSWLVPAIVILLLAIPVSIGIVWLVRALAPAFGVTPRSELAPAVSQPQPRVGRRFIR